MAIGRAVGAALSAYERGDYSRFLEIIKRNDLWDENAIREVLPSGFEFSGIREQQSVDASTLTAFAAEMWEWDELRGIDVFKKAAALGSTDALASLGRASLWMGDYASASEWLARAVLEDEGHSSSLRGDLGEALWEAGSSDHHHIEDLLETGMLASPRYGLPLSKLLVKEGRIEEARRLLERLVEGSEYGAAIQLGNLLVASSADSPAAVRAYLKGIETGDAFCAFNLAILYWRQRDMVEAERFRALAREMGDITDWPDDDFCEIDESGEPGNR